MCVMVSLKFNGGLRLPLIGKSNKMFEGMKVKYLGNVVTTWAKGEGCAEKALSTLWQNHMRHPSSGLNMRVSVSMEGLQALTKEHGITQYWAHRITFCDIDQRYSRLCVFVYRHEGGRLSQELRCHAVLCSSQSKASELARDIGQCRQRAVMLLKTNRCIRLRARGNSKLAQRKACLGQCQNNVWDMAALKVIDECPVAEEAESEEVLICEKRDHLDESDIWHCTIWSEEKKIERRENKKSRNAKKP